MDLKPYDLNDVIKFPFVYGNWLFKQWLREYSTGKLLRLFGHILTEIEEEEEIEEIKVEV